MYSLKSKYINALSGFLISVLKKGDITSGIRASFLPAYGNYLMQKHQRDQRALEREGRKNSTKMNNQISNELKSFMEQTNRTTQALIEQT